MNEGPIIFQENYEKSLLEAILANNSDEVMNVLKRYLESHDLSTEVGLDLYCNFLLNVLRLTIKHERVEILTSLFDSDEAGQFDLNTALMIAAEYGRTGIAEILLEKGAKLNYFDSMGQCPLTIAINNGHFSTADLFVSYIVKLIGSEEASSSTVSSNEDTTALVLAFSQFRMDSAASSSSTLASSFSGASQSHRSKMQRSEREKASDEVFGTEEEMSKRPRARQSLKKNTSGVEYL